LGIGISDFRINGACSALSLIPKSEIPIPKFPIATIHMSCVRIRCLTQRSRLVRAWLPTVVWKIQAILPGRWAVEAGNLSTHLPTSFLLGQPMKHTHAAAAPTDSHFVGFQLRHLIPMKGTWRRIIPALIAMTGLFCTEIVVQAGTVVNVTLHGQDHNTTPTSGLGVRLYQGGAFDFKVDNPSSTQFMGPAGTLSSTASLPFGSDIMQYIRYFPAQVSGRNVGGVGATSAMRMEELWSKHSNSVFNPPTGLSMSQAAGAFQQAVSKIEYGGTAPYGTPGSVNFGNGYVEATATNASHAILLNTASNWNISQSLNPSCSELANLVNIGAHYYHDPAGQVNQIVTPEPSSNLIWLLAAAIGVYPIMRRRWIAA